MGIDKKQQERLDYLYNKHALDVIRLRDKGFTDQDICEMMNLNPKIYKILIAHTPIC